VKWLPFYVGLLDHGTKFLEKWKVARIVKWIDVAWGPAHFAGEKGRNDTAHAAYVEFDHEHDPGKARSLLLGIALALASIFPSSGKAANQLR